MSSKRRKLITAVGATALAVAIALTGTFAWQSICQQAQNEAMASVNPGGRLHDDFDGRNKDVYVENFTAPGEGTPIFARVRLDEYMEIGSGAGLKSGDDGFAEKKATSLEVDAELEDVGTWKTHIPGAKDNKFEAYWDWTTGGSTTYMPTFNKNKDSLAADINGTYEGTTPDDETHYDDYKAWNPGEQKTADAIYDADTNDTDEGEGALEGTNIEKKNETHTAKATGTATVKTMQEWLDEGANPGAYWVWDEDGWAYWAQAIQPGEATGLLLDGIVLKSTLSDSWYYGINVVGQFVTADDVGQKNATGFYDTKAGRAPSKNAEALLAKIGVKYAPKADKVEVNAAGDVTTVVKGQTLQFNASVKLGGQLAESQVVTWAVSGNNSQSTKISETGLLTVGADETATSLTVTATHMDDAAGEVVGSKTVTINSTPEADKVEVTAAGNANSVVQGKTLQFNAKVKLGSEDAKDQTVTWTVSGNKASGTNINTSGLLTVAADESAQSLTVTATHTDAVSGQIQGSASVKVSTALAGQIEGITPGSTTTVNIDGTEFYVLAKESGRAMLMTKDVQEEKAFDADSPRWQDSDMRTYLNGTWLNSKPTLQQYAVSTTIKTRSSYNGSNFDTTNDKVFLLSEADVFGTQNSSAAQADDYTYKGGKINAPGGSWVANYQSSSHWYWLRSPRSNAVSVAGVGSGGILSYNNCNLTSGGVRPVLWINL